MKFLPFNLQQMLMFVEKKNRKLKVLLEFCLIRSRRMCSLFCIPKSPTVSDHRKASQHNFPQSEGKNEKVFLLHIERAGSSSCLRHVKILMWCICMQNKKASSAAELSSFTQHLLKFGWSCSVYCGVMLVSRFAL